MRIQNNITAKNTHRQYEINNAKVSKSAEKLSSGYRINRAADDAAGLAISEKMRSQIRGLNMASKNSQDAISLVQTAEGALQETHAMLQRMNELAVQSATGTNQTMDRDALAKEFEQLKNEINDIAEQTTFNNMKILDGSISFTGYVRSARTSGITWSKVSGSPGGSSVPAVPGNLKVGGEESTLSLGASFDPTALSDGDTFTVNGKTLTVSTTQATADGIIGMSTITGTVNPQTGRLDSFLGLAAAISGALGPLQHAYTTDMSDPTALKIEGFEGTTSISANIGGTVYTGSAPTPGSTPEAWAHTAVSDDQVRPGLRFTAFGRTYVVEGGGTTAQGSEIGLGNVTDVQGLAAALRAKEQRLFFTVTGDGITISPNIFHPDVEYDLTGASIAFPGGAAQAPGAGNAGYTHTMQFDTIKMKDGDTYDITIEGVTKRITFDSGQFASTPGMSAGAAMALSVAKEFGHEEWAKGNAIIVKSNDPNAMYAELLPDGDITKVDKDQWAANGLRIQVGALENEQLTISIDAMNTAGLGLDDATLETQDTSGTAITAVREAVNIVSDQRATLGATQNRLDHKIANLKVSSENLSAAESRIRDVDMAAEMATFTKNNILSQAAVAMLAQANSLPQNVLSLLG